MSRSATSLRVYGLYLMPSGALLAAAPNVVLGLVHLPGAHEVWIRVMGVLLFNVGIFYLVSADVNHRALYKATVFCRFLAAAAFVAFVGLRLAPPAFLGFAAVELVGAIWTLMALLSDRWAGRVVIQA